MALNPNTKLEIFKLVGTGNDFVFVDLRSSQQKKSWKTLLQKKNRSKFAQEICRRQTGVGSDGLVILEPHPTYDFKWDFYNSDGSLAEMCGNAARCAVYLLNKKECSFLTKAGVVKGKILSALDQLVQVELARPEMKKESMKISVDGKNIEGDFINSGVPHFVIHTKWEFERLPDRMLSLKIQNHRAFGAQHTNVTYVCPRDRSQKKYRTITFERGVCDFTQSCGTGALAAGFSVSKNKSNKKVSLKTPGGELEVEFYQDRNVCHLRGPVQKTFAGHLDIGRK
ncbi:MAG: diaminopimelate epimerase [Bdellovibrionales bacterium]